MPANDLQYVATKLLASAVGSLRENAITPRLVNRRFDTVAGQKFSTLDVPIPSSLIAEDVAPGVTPSTGQAIAPTRVPISLDFWKKSGFPLTDKEISDAGEGVIPMQSGEAVKAIINSVDKYILAKMYKAAYMTGGTAGTTPFATTLAAFTAARTKLNAELCPTADRRVLLNADAEGNATSLPIFLNADQRGDQNGIINGEIGRKVGADWFMNQNVLNHTAGVPGGTPTGTGTIGTKTLTIAAGGVSGTYKAGDNITMAGSTQEYVVDADVTLNGSGAGALSVSPALRSSPASALVTIKATHAANLLFHRDAFAFASRPLSNIGDGMGSIIQSAVDEVSGLVIRLEISRQNKQMLFEYDVLCGGAVVRPEFIARILG